MGPIEEALRKTFFPVLFGGEEIDAGFSKILGHSVIFWYDGSVDPLTRMHTGTDITTRVKHTVVSMYQCNILRGYKCIYCPHIVRAAGQTFIGTYIRNDPKRQLLRQIALSTINIACTQKFPSIQSNEILDLPNHICEKILKTTSINNHTVENYNHCKWNRIHPWEEFNPIANL